MKEYILISNHLQATEKLFQYILLPYKIIYKGDFLKWEDFSVQTEQEELQ